jgi:hypothetical protein
MIDEQSHSVTRNGSGPDHDVQKPVATTHVNDVSSSDDELLSGRMLPSARVVAVLITALVGIASVLRR